VWAAGRIGGAVDFSRGDDDFVLVPDPSNGRLDFDADDFSISLWFRTTQAVPLERYLRLVAKLEVVAASRVGFEIYVATSASTPPHVTFKLWSATGNFWVSAGSDVNDGKWHHVVARKTPQKIQLILDGVQESASHDVRSVSNAAPIQVGGQPGVPASDFDGQIDDLRLYRRTLTDAEVAALGAP
jgi:sialidase-1